MHVLAPNLSRCQASGEPPLQSSRSSTPLQRADSRHGAWAVAAAKGVEQGTITVGWCILILTGLGVGGCHVTLQLAERFLLESCGLTHVHLLSCMAPVVG